MVKCLNGGMAYTIVLNTIALGHAGSSPASGTMDKSWHICACSRFTLWYVDDDGAGDLIDACTCGHPRSEHLDGMHSCVGEVRLI
jgi:hypothetical protein